MASYFVSVAFEKLRETVSTAHQGGELDRMDKLFDKVCNLGEEGSDWISQLPDELLVNILSRLIPAEVISTSVLSTRWTNLWKSAVSVLDFDASEEVRAIRRLKRASKVLPEKRRRYMNWVNRVVPSCKRVVARD